jgi:DNA-binding LacI/PurR family transcriptional regulator/DNA-binding transcriptional regulator YhcF (GntR family)
MPSLHRLSVAEQISAQLREELSRGRWRDKMPGVIRLADELEVSRNSVEAALRQLESEGLLIGQGLGRNRLIAKSRANTLHPMRVAILLFELVDRQLEYIGGLQHALVEAGHSAIFPSKSLSDLGMKAARVRRLVKQTAADAWVIVGGNREVLEWFSKRPEPSFALFGRREGLPLAATGPDKPSAFVAATKHLIGFGHRRIALLARHMRRRPEPGRTERAFLGELEAHNIPFGDFNLPDWEETKEGYQELLSSLFRVTPPTALIIEEAPFFIATQQFLARVGLSIPEDVSLICADPDPAFSWCEPTVAHIRWDSRPVVRRLVRWAATVSRGGRDVRQDFVAAEFVEGGTVGPAPVE